MSPIISLKVTKFQQPLLITVGVADEKPEGDIGLSQIADITVDFKKLVSNLFHAASSLVGSESIKKKRGNHNGPQAQQ